MNNRIGRREFLRQTALLGGAAAIGYRVTLGLANNLDWAQGETRPALVIIHRQALQAAPQNRWAALKQAVQWGADQTVTLEVDLHATKDGRIILYHDPDFDFKSDEVLGHTTDWLWEEINDVDFGSWYDRRALELCAIDPLLRAPRSRSRLARLSRTSQTAPATAGFLCLP